jgi:SAM-dependent methyltransferase
VPGADRSEADRIARVYRAYREDSSVQERWDPANPGNRASVAERSAVTEAWLRRLGFLPLSDRRILDVGCGKGRDLARFLALGARPENLFGVDLLPERIESARSTYPAFQFECTDARALPYPEESFDLVLLSTVLSSVLEEHTAAAIASEASRVLKPGGAILWYDLRYRNPFNPNVRRVSRADLRRYFAGFSFSLRSVTVLPPLSRRLGGWAPALYPFLARLPFLRSHLLGLLQKPRPVPASATARR